MNEPTPIRPPAQANAEPSYRRVFVRDLILPCAIGVHAHEQDAPQRVRINVDLMVREVDLALQDRIENVVSYEHIVKGARALTSDGHINLVETLAERIADLCLADARVSSVRVRVEKLDIYEQADSVGVEIERLQSEN
ncbi:MAG: dihydroneopterin aldolase [Rhodospirillaceae bacterium]|nr:dihydroneopterin aldolase [Rhodospirillaceae bacterium]MBT3926898.1 dihydroneopterin aldolase [Rhodospirillaceae bacterium]MBT4425796.1 dihydroneopterin aldolase [Rhodospirillaceae bacterium]MBT5040240.1 dihydroneopterin aldolase [Rhodospirillaceae bacterium]MBT5777907.1 dihydroneopterin aldolase [Rhodospirillaceae bacterium]